MSTFSEGYNNGANGQSTYGQGYTSAFQYLGHNAGARDRASAAEAAASANASTPSTYVSSVSPTLPALVSPIVGGSGHVSLRSRRRFATDLTIRGIVLKLLLAAVLFGAYDGVVQHSSAQHSGATAFDTVTGISNRFGTAITSINPESQILAAVNGVRTIATTILAVGVGVGANLGNEASSVMGAFITSWRDASQNQNASTQTAVATHASLFEQGAADRRSWETWFDGLSGDRRDGAYFWSAVRGSSNPGTCFDGPGQTSQAYREGCTAAQKFFAQVDPKRVPKGGDYWCGWNSPEQKCGGQ